MKLNDVMQRAAAGEVVIADSIEDMYAEEYVQKYPSLFAELTVEDDVLQAGVCFIYDAKQVYPL